MTAKPRRAMKGASALHGSRHPANGATACQNISGNPIGAPFALTYQSARAFGARDD
jgi:hypothetical protein